ncbi:MAG: tetratricopeptide repeat protein, partial [Candidatus Poribacteria bacterium]
MGIRSTSRALTFVARTLCVVAVFLTLGAADAGTRRALSRAEVALRQKDYAEAARHVNEAIARAPLHAAAHVQRGILNLKQGDLAGAAASLTRATELDADSFAARYHLGLAHLRLGELDAAHDEFTRATRLNPEQPLALYHLGVALSGQRKYGDAARAFEAAVELDPDMSSAYYRWGNAELRRGNAEDGRALLAKFRGVKAQKRIRQAVVRARRGDSDRAAQLLERALEMDRDHPSAYHALAFLAFVDGRWDDAVRHARRYVGLRPASEDMRVLLGAASRRGGEPQVAMDALAVALDGVAPHAEARYELAEAHVLAGDLEAAARQFRQAMADDPTLYQAAYRAGAVLLDLDRPSEAAVALREAIAHCPRDQNPSDPPGDDFFHG